MEYAAGDGCFGRAGHDAAGIELGILAHLVHGYADVGLALAVLDGGSVKGPHHHSAGIGAGNPVVPAFYADATDTGAGAAHRIGQRSYGILLKAVHHGGGNVPAQSYGKVPDLSHDVTEYHGIGRDGLFIAVQEEMHGIAGAVPDIRLDAE